MLNSVLTGMRRSPYQTLAAILMATLTAFVGFAFSLISLGADQILRYFERQPQVIAFFDLDTPVSRLEEVATQFNQYEYVTETRIVTQEEALRLYQEENRDDPLLLELVSADILPPSVEISGTTSDSLIQIRDQLTTTQGVDEVVLQEDVINTLGRWIMSLRYFGLGASLILGLTSFLLIMVIIGMKVTQKRQAIYIMRMIGATRWYIKLPFILEGLLYGLVGSLLGWTVMFAGLLYLTPWLEAFLDGIPLFPVPPAILAMQLGFGTLIAMTIGGFAGMVAAQRHLRR